MADPITTLPSAPSRQDPDNFSDEADDLLGALDQFVTETNAVAVAMNLNDTNDVSSSSVLIGLGAKTFTVTAAKSFLPGMYLVIADDAAPSTNSMIGQVTSYSGTTLVMNITGITGSGTKSAWTISQSVPVGTTAGPISGTTGTFTGDIITTEDIKIGDGKFIGSTSAPGAMSIDAAGAVTKPLQPAFLAQITSTVTNVTGDGTVYSLAAAIWTEIYDQGADFLNGTFTAPVTGRYHFDFILTFSGITANHTKCTIILVASNRQVALYKGSPNTDKGGLTYVTKEVSYDIDMDLGDTFYITVNVGETNLYIDIEVNTIMSGHLIA